MVLAKLVALSLRVLYSLAALSQSLKQNMPKLTFPLSCSKDSKICLTGVLK